MCHAVKALSGHLQIFQAFTADRQSIHHLHRLINFGWWGELVPIIAVIRREAGLYPGQVASRRSTGAGRAASEKKHAPKKIIVPH